MANEFSALFSTSEEKAQISTAPKRVISNEEEIAKAVRTANESEKSVTDLSERVMGAPIKVGDKVKVGAYYKHATTGRDGSVLIMPFYNIVINDKMGATFSGLNFASFGNISNVDGSSTKITESDFGDNICAFEKCSVAACSGHALNTLEKVFDGKILVCDGIFEFVDVNGSRRKYHFEVIDA